MTTNRTHPNRTHRLPWAFWLPESSRWLMATRGDFKGAKEQLIRVAKWNGRKLSAEFEKKLNSLELKINSQRLKHQESSINNKQQGLSKASLSSIRSLDASSKLDLVAVAVADVANSGDKGTNQIIAIGKDFPLATIATTETRTTSKSERRSYRRMLITNKTLLKDTLILAYVQFAGHMFYYYLTIDFAYTENLSLEANFITSGVGEWIACLAGAVALRFFSRRACMSFMMSLIGLTFAMQALIDSKSFTILTDSYLVVTTNNAIGTLASLLLIFVTLIVNQEVYPTVVRQSGTSIVNTFGEFGSSLSPLMLQLTRAQAHWTSNLPHALFCIIGAILVRSVSKTDDKDLADT